MKTIQINLYEFSELSEDAKQIALEKLYDINVDGSFDWWDNNYEDAKNVGIKINSFDLGRGESVDIDNYETWHEIADLIIKNHGEQCQTFKDAKEFLKQRDILVYKYSDGKNIEVVIEKNEIEFDDYCDNLEHEFKTCLENDYLKMLRQEYEYLTSEDAIIDTITTNEYSFLEDGALNHY